MGSGRNALDRLWDIIISIAATISAIDIPLRLVLPRHGDGWLFTDWTLTALFCADIFIRRRRAGVIAPTFLGRPAGPGWMALDILAALPVQIFGVGTPLHLLRLLKLPRAAQFMSALRQRGAYNANKLRLLFFPYWLGICAHWIACGWIALRTADDSDSFSRYFHAIYWCVTTLTTVGYGDVTPANNWQRMYAMIVMIIGVGVYGYVIGNIASLLANIDPARTKYMETMERLTAFMRYRHIPHDLQNRIRDYYNYLWEKRLGYDESEILDTLPSSLGIEVSMFLKRDIIERVPMFKGASQEFIREIALRMRPMIFTPNDYVFHAGEPGREMYFISQGVLDVVSADGTDVYSTLTDGDFFGEIALLLGQPRTASIRAVTYCDLYRLDKEMFERVLADYPDIAEHIGRMTKERRENDERRSANQAG
ncbi:MAG: cyclic nucleotide-binding domain-containing protein [Candidatus Kapaibacterium sp.]